MAFRTSNPILNDKRFAKMNSHSSEHMTVEGTMNKTLMFFLVLFLTASYTWSQVFSGNAEAMTKWLGYVWPVMIATLIIAIVIAFKPTLAKSLGFVYAGLEGLFIGLISAFFELMYPNIVVQAVALTLGVALIMFFLLRSKIIKVTNKLRIGIVSATGAIFLFYMVSWISSFFGVTYFSNLLNSSSPLSIGISVVIVIVAAFNLLLDYDFIERASKNRMSKDLEWYGAFGLMVTLIWLYLEILRLLAKLNDRR